MTTRSKPKLTEIDLSLAVEHNHPHIKPGKTQYLAKFKGDNRLYLGTFSKEWYGLNFDCDWGGRQFDAPGYNSSSWKRLWVIEWAD